MRRFGSAVGALAIWLGSAALGLAAAPDARAGDDLAYGVIVDTTDPRSIRLAT